MNNLCFPTNDSTHIYSSIGNKEEIHHKQRQLEVVQNDVNQVGNLYNDGDRDIVQTKIDIFVNQVGNLYNNGARTLVQRNTDTDVNQIGNLYNTGDRDIV